MKKKLLYIDEVRIEMELIALNQLSYDACNLFSVLNKEFGITDPESIKNPVEVLHKKIKDSSPVNGFDTPIENTLKLIDKVKEYKSIMSLKRRVVNHKYLDLLDFVGERILIKPDAEEIIRDKMTPFVTVPEQIEFVERLERFANEAKYFSDKMGITLGNTDFYRTFKVYNIKGKHIAGPGAIQ